MIENDLPALDDDVRDLVERTRDKPAPSPGTQARVLAALENVLGPMGGGGGGGGGGAGSPGAPAAGAVSSAGDLPLAARRTAGRFTGLAVSFVLGGAVGAIAMRAVLHVGPQAPRAATAAAPSVDRPMAPAASIDVATESAIPVAAPSAARRPSTSQSDLAAERAILDAARHALEREDGEAALSATAEHQRRFPNGFLVQEREAMAIRALAMLGRVADARARTDRFRVRYPDSLLLPVLESSVRQAP